MSTAKFELTGVYSDRAARSERRGLDEHVLIVEDLGEDDFDYTVLHPESCTVWIRTSPDPWSGQLSGYDCAVSAEIDAVGFDSTFPDGLQAGMWLLSPWYHRTPSSPSGPEEHDAGVEVTLLEIRP